MFRKLKDTPEMFVPINELHGVTRQNTLSSKSYGENLNPYAFKCGKNLSLHFRFCGLWKENSKYKYLQVSS